MDRKMGQQLGQRMDDLLVVQLAVQLAAMTVVSMVCTKVVRMAEQSVDWMVVEWVERLDPTKEELMAEKSVR